MPAGLSGNHTDLKPAFYLSKEQREAAAEWRIQHDAVKHGGQKRYTGAIGGAYTWQFTGTSIGVVTVFRCTCGSKIDVSNYDEW